jgi:hypothetical protein
LTLNHGKSMTHHNQAKVLTTWFLIDVQKDFDNNIANNTVKHSKKLDTNTRTITCCYEHTHTLL